MNWQPSSIDGVTASIDGTSVNVAWSANSNMARYNVYLAHESGLVESQLNVSEMSGGQALRALQDTTAQFTVEDASQRIFVLVTGIDDSGESAFSDEVALNIPAFNVNPTISLSTPYQTALTQIDLSEFVTLNPDNGSDSFSFAPLTEQETQAGGLVSLTENGLLTYQPQDTIGPDSISFTVQSSFNTEAQGNIAITVEAPQATYEAQEFSIDFGGSTSQNLTDFINIADQSELTFSPETQTTEQGGTVTISGDGALVYSPATDYFGNDRFTIKVTTIHGESFDFTIELVVDAPVITTSDLSFSTVANEPLTGNLLSTSEIPLGALTISTELVSQPQLGEVSSISEDGTFTYSPNTDALGVDSFQFKVISEHGAEAIVTANINITERINLLSGEHDLNSNDVSDVSAAYDSGTTTWSFTFGQDVVEAIIEQGGMLKPLDISLLTDRTWQQIAEEQALIIHVLFDGGYHTISVNRLSNGFITEINKTESLQLLSMDPQTLLANQTFVEFVPDNEQQASAHFGFDNESGAEIEFNEDGTGTYRGHNGTDTFSWTVDGGRIAVATSENNNPETYTQSFNIEELNELGLLTEAEYNANIGSETYYEVMISEDSFSLEIVENKLAYLTLAQETTYKYSFADTSSISEKTKIESTFSFRLYNKNTLYTESFSDLSGSELVVQSFNMFSVENVESVAEESFFLIAQHVTLLDDGSGTIKNSEGTFTWQIADDGSLSFTANEQVHTAVLLNKTDLAYDVLLQTVNSNTQESYSVALQIFIPQVVEATDLTAQISGKIVREKRADSDKDYERYQTGTNGYFLSTVQAEGAPIGEYLASQFYQYDSYVYGSPVSWSVSDNSIVLKNYSDSFGYSVFCQPDAEGQNGCFESYVRNLDVISYDEVGAWVLVTEKYLTNTIYDEVN